jgi:hypothetical protein
MDSLNISTGEKRLPIIRDGANVGELVFNPHDAVLAEKFYRLIDKLNALIGELKITAKDIETRTTTDADGIPNTGLEFIGFARKAHEALCTEYDTLFGSGTSAMIFGGFVPLTEEGFAVHEQFVNGFAPYFQKARGDKVAKYTNKRPKRK